MNDKLMIDFPRGIYQHFKGNYYEVVAIARSSETLEYLVIYKALYGDFGLWVRPLIMFQESVFLNEQKVPRFKFISSESSENFLKKLKS